jgi:hypothetical protein
VFPSRLIRAPPSLTARREVYDAKFMSARARFGASIEAIHGRP